MAPRRFGKSSLIREAIQHCKVDGKFTAYINLLSNSTPESLSFTLIKEALKNLGLHKEFLSVRKGKSSYYLNEELNSIAAAFPFIARLDDESADDWELLNQCIDFPEALTKSQKKGLVCAFDNFGMGGTSDSSGKISRLITERTGEHISTTYIFSGHNELALLPLKEVHMIRMGYIDCLWLVESLNKKFARLKIKLPRNYTETLVNFTRGHPFYTRLAFQQIILASHLDGTLPRSKELIKRLLKTEQGYIEKVWEDLSRNKEYVHTMMALLEGNRNIYKRLKSKKINVARAQKNLEGLGYLMKNSTGGYNIADPLLEHWLRKNR